MRSQTSDCLNPESIITLSATFTPAEAVSPQPRAFGDACIVTRQAGGRTVLDRLYQAGASRLLLPRTGGTDLTGVILNTAGGVTGGDRFDIAATAGPDCDLTLTTQAAERIYQAQPGETGAVSTRLKAHRGARLNWLPQETILFDNSALRRRLSVDLDSDATFTMVEPVIFGRTAMGEDIRAGCFTDTVDIHRDGRLCFADATRVSGDMHQHLAHPAIANGARAMASVLYAAENAEGYLTPLRGLMPATGGVSLVRPGILFCRLLAEDSYALRQTLIPVIQTLTGAPLPRTWNL